MQIHHEVVSLKRKHHALNEVAELKIENQELREELQRVEEQRGIEVTEAYEEERVTAQTDEEDWEEKMGEHTLFDLAR